MFGEQAAKILEAVTVFSQNNIPELIDQFLNYMIFVNVMSALRSIGIIFVSWLLVKTLNGVIRIYKEERNISMISFLDFIRACIIALSIGLSVLVAWQPTLIVAKILIAPKVFLIEEGAEFLKNNKK